LHPSPSSLCGCQNISLPQATEYQEYRRKRNMAWLDLDSLVVGLVIFALVWEAKLRLQQWFFPPRPAKHLVEVVD
jgi:hypothetical protein